MEGHQLEGQAWLRAQLTAFSCASCGRSYEQGRIRILAQRDDLWFVSMRCDACGSGALGLVTIRDDDESGEGTAGAGVPAGVTAFRGDLTDTDQARLADGSPVDTDDLLETHRFLTRFDGDFRRLFGGGEGR